MGKFIYEVATGRLHSWTRFDSDPIANPEEIAANGFAVLEIDGAIIDQTHVWNPSTHSIDEVPPPYEPRDIPCSRFILAFTPSELAAVRGSSDPAVQQLMLAVQVTPEIDMNRPSTINGVWYLAQQGFITSERATAILATE